LLFSLYLFYPKFLLAFLVLCDTLAKVLIVPVEILVGVITALLGGPFFIWLLINNSGEGSSI